VGVSSDLLSHSYVSPFAGPFVSREVSREISPPMLSFLLSAYMSDFRSFYSSSSSRESSKTSSSVSSSSYLRTYSRVSSSLYSEKNSPISRPLALEYIPIVPAPVAMILFNPLPERHMWSYINPLVLRTNGVSVKGFSPELRVPYELGHTPYTLDLCVMMASWRPLFEFRFHYPHQIRVMTEEGSYELSVSLTDSTLVAMHRYYFENMEDACTLKIELIKAWENGYCPHVEQLVNMSLERRDYFMSLLTPTEQLFLAEGTSECHPVHLCIPGGPKARLQKLYKHYNGQVLLSNEELVPLLYATYNLHNAGFRAVAGGVAKYISANSTRTDPVILEREMFFVNNAEAANSGGTIETSMSPAIYNAYFEAGPYQGLVPYDPVVE